ncbi:unnamed protein product, partial [marine sediment metagenome]
MIRFMRKAKIIPGKGIEALQFSNKIVEHGKQNFKGMPNTNVFIEEFGDYATMHWHTDFESLAEYEKIRNQGMADPQYLE